MPQPVPPLPTQQRNSLVCYLFEHAAREEGVALVLSTHNVGLAARCDKTIALKNERVTAAKIREQNRDNHKPA